MAVLATFWSTLLGWPISSQEENGAAMAPEDNGVAYLSIQLEEQYVRDTGRPGPASSR